MGSNRLVWNRGKFAICGPGKDGEPAEWLIKGHLAGPFGVHQKKGDWIFTHLVTGFMLTTEKTIGKIKGKAQELVDQTTGGITPWANPDPLSVREELCRAGLRVLGKRKMSSATESGVGISK